MKITIADGIKSTILNDSHGFLMELDAQNALAEAFYFEINTEDCLIEKLTDRPRSLGQFQDDMTYQLKMYADDCSWGKAKLFEDYKESPDYRDLEFGKKQKKW